MQSLRQNSRRLAGAYCGAGMATRALRRRGLVEKHLFVRYFTELRVAPLAGRVLVCALQRKEGLLVIEVRRPPAVRVVAFRAARHTIGVGELRPMWVVMTLLARCGSGLEIHVHELALHGRRAVAADALNRLVSAGEIKLGGGVIEPLQVVPSLRRVAGLATGGFAMLSNTFHPRAELAAMWI